MLKFQKKFIPFFFLWIIFCSFTGFEYRNIKTKEPLSIHVIEIDPRKYEIKPTLANWAKIKTETVLEIAKKNNAIAAINGGFFKLDGRAAGILRIDQKWMSLPEQPRAAIGWNKSNSFFVIDRLDAKAFITLGSLEILIDGINRPRVENEKIIYLHPQYFTYATYLLSSQILSKSCILAIDPEDEISNLLQFNNFDYKINVFPILCPSQPPLWEDLDHIVGGTPLLIYNKEKIFDYSSEKTLERFLSKKYARTAIGIKENGNLLFVVVDRDNYKNSIGVTIDELRDIMYDLGSIYALNLDGGSSSTMIINDKLVNAPEDSFMDKVSDAILILQKDCFIY